MALADAATQSKWFERMAPDYLALLFPLKWLWIWFTRRFDVFSTPWNASEPESSVLLDGMVMGEDPRFHWSSRCLYLSDMYGKHVLKYDITTQTSGVVFEHSDYVSGLGWLPDGRLLIVAMNTRQVLAVNEATKETSVYADLAQCTRFRANDMVVSPFGHAYVGNFGFDLEAWLPEFTTTTLVRIDNKTQATTVEATRLLFPNGAVITPDGKTLIVAETLALRLTAFDIQHDGSLSNRRLWAYVGCPLDGICLDAEGCVWAAVPKVCAYNTAGALLRIQEGGKILNLYGFGRNGIHRQVFACQLGTDRNGKHHLFFLEAHTPEEKVARRLPVATARKNSVLRSIQVAVGPARSALSAVYCGGYC